MDERLLTEGGLGILTEASTTGPWPTVASYKAWARIPADDVEDDPTIAVSLGAATDAVVSRCPRVLLPAPEGPAPDCPAELYEAVMLWTNRLLARRNSPTGVVGVDDTGSAMVPGKDADIARMLSPWREPVLG